MTPLDTVEAFIVIPLDTHPTFDSFQSHRFQKATGRRQSVGFAWAGPDGRSNRMYRFTRTVRL